MKNLYMFLAIMAGVLLNAQEVVISSQGISPLIIKADSISADIQYSRVKKYILKKFKTPEDVLKVDEKNVMIRFVGYEHFESGIASSGDYFYSCQVEFKDARFKISFDDVYMIKGSGVKTYVADIYNKNGELRRYDYYKNLLNNFTQLLNGISVEIISTVKNDDTEGW